MVNSPDIELAKRLACAWISHQLGMSYEHLMKTRIQPLNEIEQYWIDLANKVSSERSSME